jgi:hypothetical protein
MEREMHDNKDRELEERAESDYSGYRLKRLLEILLEADLKWIDEFCQEEKKEKTPFNLKNKPKKL